MGKKALISFLLVSALFFLPSCGFPTLFTVTSSDYSITTKKTDSTTEEGRGISYLDTSVTFSGQIFQDKTTMIHKQYSPALILAYAIVPTTNSSSIISGLQSSFRSTYANTPNSVHLTENTIEEGIASYKYNDSIYRMYQFRGNDVTDYAPKYIFSRADDSLGSYDSSLMYSFRFSFEESEARLGESAILLKTNITDTSSNDIKLNRYNDKPFSSSISDYNEHELKDAAKETGEGYKICLFASFYFGFQGFTNSIIAPMKFIGEYDLSTLTGWSTV